MVNLEKREEFRKTHQNNIFPELVSPIYRSLEWNLMINMESVLRLPVERIMSPIITEIIRHA